MAEEIVNRVAQSSLQVFDLEDYYVEGKRVALDVKQWLFQELILKEKDFRAALEAQDWELYKNAFVAVYCSTDAIVPTWAYMLVVSKLKNIAKKVVLGTITHLETTLYRTVLDGLDYTSYQNKPVIIKGCSKKPVPLDAYGYAQEKLQGIAKRIAFGEACSSVPIWKP